MVSVTVEVVSVWLVILPCVKFGTTGTAIAGAATTLAHATTLADFIRRFHIFPSQLSTRLQIVL